MDLEASSLTRRVSGLGGGGAAGGRRAALLSKGGEHGNRVDVIEIKSPTFPCCVPCLAPLTIPARRAHRCDRARINFHARRIRDPLTKIPKTKQNSSLLQGHRDIIDFSRSVVALEAPLLLLLRRPGGQPLRLSTASWEQVSEKDSPGNERETKRDRKRFSIAMVFPSFFPIFLAAFLP